MMYYEMIQQLCDEYPNYWDYYRIHRCQSFFEHFRRPRLFIRSTFQYAQKQGLINRDNTEQPEISEARAAHSISAFFLGFMLAKNLGEGRALHFYARQSNDAIPSEFSFSYMWTLLCLYHDYGYYLEKDDDRTQHLIREIYSVDMRKFESETDFCQMVAQKPAKLFFKKTNIQNYIWMTEVPLKNQRSQNEVQKSNVRDDSTNHVEKQIIQAYVDQPKILFLQGENQPILFPIRSKETIDEYFGYRLFPEKGRTPCVDHGIAGGLLFFDSLIKNYAKVYCKAKRKKPDVNIENFTYNGKRFSFDQLTVFAYIADCIINHNIWKATSDSEKGRIYKAIGLDSLLDENYKKVNFYENPLLFILSIADSIEPYKLFSNPQIDDAPYDLDQLCYIMDHTHIRFTPKSIVVKAPEGHENNLLHQAREMKKWIDIDYRHRNGEIFITPIGKA